MSLVPGIYTRGGPLTWLGRAWAGVLLGGDHATLGGTSAAFLHGLEKAEPTRITVYTRRQVSPKTGFQFIRRTRTSGGEPPRTTYEATVVDLCADLDEDELAALLADALSSRKTKAKQLLDEIAGRRRVPHRNLLRQVLGDTSQGAHSALERRYLTDVERAHGLPAATRQAHAHAKHRNDVWYEDYGLLVELDGKAHHRGSAALHDRARDNDHALLGLITLRFGWNDVAGIAACQTAELVAAALAGRGWPGPLTPCSRCARVHDV